MRTKLITVLAQLKFLITLTSMSLTGLIIVLLVGSNSDNISFLLLLLTVVVYLLLLMAAWEQLKDRSRTHKRL
jgi:NADH:ubiquinone oxidoreductase subunit 4 (subunit M)